MRFAGKVIQIRKIIISVFLFYSFVVPTANAEKGDTLSNIFVPGMRLHYGFVYKHSKSLKSLDDSYPLGLQFDFNWHYVSQKAWNFCNCYPRIGASVYLWNYGNPDELGNGIEVVGYVEPFFGCDKKFSFSLRAAAGFAYLTKPYDSISNPENMAYSTRISFPLIINTTLNYQLKKNIFLNLTAAYNHISNGGIKQPNKGLNYPTICIGADYFFRNPKFFKKEIIDWKMLSPEIFFYYLSFYSAVKQISHSDYKKYFIWGIFAKYSRRVARLSALNCSTEWIDHGASKEILKRENRSDVSHYKGGLLIGHEFLLGRFVFSQQFGFYYYDPAKLDDPVYQRYGLSFKISKKIFAETNLLAHRQIADFLDFRIGVCF